MTRRDWIIYQSYALSPSSLTFDFQVSWCLYMCILHGLLGHPLQGSGLRIPCRDQCQHSGQHMVTGRDYTSAQGRDCLLWGTGSSQDRRGCHPSAVYESHNNMPVNKRRWSNVALMLARRRRRWANIKTTLVQSLSFAGYICLSPAPCARGTFDQRCLNRGPTSSRLNQHCATVFLYWFK